MGLGQMAQLGHSPSPQSTPLGALCADGHEQPSGPAVPELGFLGPNVRVGLTCVLACGISRVILMCSECLGSQTRLQHSRRLQERQLPPLIYVTLTIFPIND